MANETERAQYEEVDIDNLEVAEEYDGFGEKFNPEEDAYDTASPIPECKGGYKFKLTIPEENFLQKLEFEDRQGRTIVNFKASFICTVTDEGEHQDRMLFGDVSTSIPRGKNNCTMATLLSKLYGWLNIKKSVPSKKSELVLAFKDVLLKEPIIPAVIAWEAWEPGDGDRYKLVKRGMENFPKKADGSYSNVVKGKTGEVAAKAKVKRFLSREELAAKKGGTPMASGKPVNTAKPVPTNKPVQSAPSAPNKASGAPVAAKKVTKPLPPPPPVEEPEEEIEEGMEYAQE